MMAKARLSDLKAQSVVQSSESDPLLDELMGLMRRRLLLMHDVARAKWNAKKPIADVGREKIMLRELAEKGRAMGLEPEFTSEYFSRKSRRLGYCKWRTYADGKRSGRGRLPTPQI